MDPARTWAKSKRDHESLVPSMILPGHLADVYSASLPKCGTVDEQARAVCTRPAWGRRRMGYTLFKPISRD